MITAKEARNAIAVKNGHKDWEQARCRMGADDINELMIEAMEYYAEQSNSHKQVVMQTLPFSFVEWYSGMQKEKIESAYQRWMKEGNVAVGSEGYGEANTCAGGSKCVDIEIEEGYYQCEKCGRTSRG